MGAIQRVKKMIGKDKREIGPDGKRIGPDERKKIYFPGWYIQYRDLSGKQVWKAFESKKEAEDYLADKKTEMRKVLREGYGGASRPGLTFGELIDAFLDYSKEHKRSYIGDKLNSTLPLNHFGKDKPAQKIIKEDVENFITYLQKERKLGPAAINRYLALLKTAYHRAIENGWIKHTPMRGIKIGIGELKEPPPRSRILTDEEYSRLLFAAADHLKPIIRLAWGTGMRRGEILELTWERVDLKGGWINLRPEDTKTNVGRKIPLSPELVAMFQEIKQSQAGKVVDIRAGNLVFLRREGRAWCKVGIPRSAFESACRRAKIEDFHFHDLRHCFVTRSRRAGYQDRRIMAITGHKTMSVFMRYDTVDREAEEKELREIVKQADVFNLLASGGKKNGDAS